MTHLQLRTLLLDARDCATLDEYIAECGGSVPAEYAGENAVALLTDLWQFREGIPFRQLREFAGLRIADFVRLYGIPLRTVQNWDAGFNAPPSYLLELILADVLNTRKAED